MPLSKRTSPCKASVSADSSRWESTTCSDSCTADSLTSFEARLTLAADGLRIILEPLAGCHGLDVSVNLTRGHSMKSVWARMLCRLLMVLMVWSPMQFAQAGMIGTDQVVTAASQADR